MGYEGLYEVSNLGRVKSLARTKKGKSGCDIPIPEKILSFDEGEHKKQRCTLFIENSRKKIFVHILVAKSFPDFCGKWFDGCEVHHKDQNPSNNRIDNLIVLTHNQHIETHNQLGIRNGDKNPFWGKHHSNKTKEAISYKNSVPIVQFFENDLEFPLANWDSGVECEKFTGINRNHISRVLKGKQKSTFGFIFKYA